MWYVRTKTGGPETGDRARTLTWVEVASGTSIIFDLRITAVAGGDEPETRSRFVVEAIRIVGALLLEKAAVKPRKTNRSDPPARSARIRRISHAKI